MQILSYTHAQTNNDFRSIDQYLPRPLIVACMKKYVSCQLIKYVAQSRSTGLDFCFPVVIGIGFTKPFKKQKSMFWGCVTNTRFCQYCHFEKKEALFWWSPKQNLLKQVTCPVTYAWCNSWLFCHVKPNDNPTVGSLCACSTRFHI